MYPAWYRVAKRVLAAIVVAGVSAAAITSTVSYSHPHKDCVLMMTQVVISTRQAFITGVSDDDVANALIRVYYRPPLGAQCSLPSLSVLILLSSLYQSTGNGQLISHGSSFSG